MASLLIRTLILLVLGVACVNAFRLGPKMSTGGVPGDLIPTLMKPHQKVWPDCPYNYKWDDNQDFIIGGEGSFQCHIKATGRGNTSPRLQQDRLKVVKKYQASIYNDLIDRAKAFPLRPLFDKSEHVRGTESYEEMVRLHVNGLMHKDVVDVEDKIMLKKLTKKLDIPATTTYFGAHIQDWDKDKFKRMLGDLCLRGIDEFIIKAVHLAWSKGQKIVRGWQGICEAKNTTDSMIDAVATFVDEEIMGQLASEADGHLREYVTPGVTVEELFRTGGVSGRPLEVKVQVLWGKVHHMFFIGDDPRGCDSFQGAWSYYGDKTGWDLKGMLGEIGTNDEISDLILKNAFDGMVEGAEKFATAVGADVMRVDFFIGFEDDGSVIYKLNEVESVSGARYWHERDGLGRAWVDGYVLSDRVTMTTEKWDTIAAQAEEARAKSNLD